MEERRNDSLPLNKDNWIIHDNMGNGESLGILKILGVVGCIGLLGILKNYAPNLFTNLLTVGGVILVLFILLVVFVMVLALRKPKEKPGSGAENEAGIVLAKGQSDLMEVRRVTMQIKNRQIKGQAEEICKSANKILKTIRQQPENIAQIRKFLNYYLPTLRKILSKYTQMEKGNVLTPELTQSITACLEDVQKAMEKQYENLFEDDKLDFEVEMETFLMSCKRDGLLTDENMEL